MNGDFPTGHSLGVKPKVAHNTHTRASEIRFYAGFEEVLLRGKSGVNPRGAFGSGKITVLAIGAVSARGSGLAWLSDCSQWTGEPAAKCDLQPA